MMQLILESRDRFSDSDGNPLPFVQELYEFTKENQNKIENKQDKNTKEKKQNKKIDSVKNAKEDGYPEKDYPEYKGKGQEAVDFIVKNKGGQVRGAFHREEIGDIDVVWGEVTDKEKHTGYGLAHIIDKHGMDAVTKIGEAVKNGKVIHPDNNPDHIAIENNNFHVGLRQQWGGNKKIWIITGFEKDKSTAKMFDVGGHNPKTTLSGTLEEGGNAKTTRSNKNHTEETLSETSSPTISQTGEKSSNGLDAIRAKYNASK
ncbi:MAG: hypothetical protein ACTTJ6_00975 [Treponema sp.]